MSSTMINTIIETISNNQQQKRFSNYIEFIQFPEYKNLAKNTKIEFSFPLTMFVGKNGTGKSSILQALYGMPSGKSTGDYWFSTNVDPIEEGKNKYFYSYIKGNTDIHKQVLKKRVPSIKDPDYWETAAYDTSIGMQQDDNLDNQTRNTPVRKDVLYFDFRGEISSFDKYFYYYKSKTDNKNRYNERKRKDAKEFIRKNSKSLKQVFDGETVQRGGRIKYDWHEQVEIINLTKKRDILNEINFILGKQYEEIKIVYHRFYEAWGNSIYLKTNNGITYSEANAGSGEHAVINMVYSIMNMPKYSLILLDEPEVSLHPSAQIRLKEFLLKQIKAKLHQIIISTHSMFLIEDMPQGSLKLFEVLSDGTTMVHNDVYFKEAFFNIRETVDTKILIICEDISAKILIESILTRMKLADFFSVEYRHGGADTLLTRHLPILALDTLYDKVFIILDGDKRPENIIKYTDIPVGQTNNLKDLEKYILGLTCDKTTINPLVDGGKNGAVEEQKIKVYQEYLKYAENHLLFLPGNVPPEEMILTNPQIASVYAEFIPEKKETDWSKNVVNHICDSKMGINASREKNYRTSTFKILVNEWINQEDNTEYNELSAMLETIYKSCN